MRFAFRKLQFFKHIIIHCQLTHACDWLPADKASAPHLWVLLSCYSGVRLRAKQLNEAVRCHSVN